MDLLTHLNAAQREAATHVKGSVLIIAGAGSGKTRVITARIAHLLRDHNVPASAIVALTFTNKAANEMKERIAHLIGHEHALPFVGTFHAYCVRLLKQYAQLRAVPFNGIMDTDDQHKIIKSILQKHGLHKQLSATAVAHQISQIKNNPGDRNRILQEHTNPLLAQVFQAYEQEKALSHCLDFDDLLLETLALFNNAVFTNQMHARVRHILIDEYQDTNLVQHDFLKKMSLQNGTLCVDSVCAVGDEDQSIYSWRGATVTNMRNFTIDFPQTQIVKIEQNYRSAQQILDVANSVIKNNSQRTPKKLWSEKKGNNRVCQLVCNSEYQEADILAQLAQMLADRNKADTVAFLYRTHAQSRTIEEALVKQAIPYRIIGGTQFYERMEVRDLLAYLKLIVNPFDRVSCSRVLNTPARGLGAKAEEDFFTQWDSYPDSPFREILSMITEHNVTARAQGFTQFGNVFNELTPQSLPSQALTQIIQKTGYLTYLKNSYDKDEAAERCANVDELINAAVHAESMELNTIASFLESVALMQDQLTKQEENNNCVLLMTLHAAKGLEFDTVVLAGLEEGVLPTSRASHDPEALEEERRLLYVGITRARERLLFTRTRTRHTYGRLTDQIASRFAKELPDTLVTTHDAAMWRTPMVRAFLAQWLGFTTTSPIIAPTQFVQTPFTKVTHTAPPASTSNIHRAKALLNQGIDSDTVTPATKSSWRLHQPVKHASFGIGIIKEIEKKGPQTIITAQFRNGTKKIVSDFLIPL